MHNAGAFAEGDQSSALFSVRGRATGMYHSGGVIGVRDDLYLPFQRSACAKSLWHVRHRVRAVARSAQRRAVHHH